MLRYFLSGTVLLFSLTVSAEGGAQAAGAQAGLHPPSQGSGQAASGKVANQIAEMRGMRGKVLKMIQEAEKKKDAIKTGALREILQKIEAATNRAEQALDRLEKAPGEMPSAGIENLEHEVAASLEECSQQTAMADTVVGEDMPLGPQRPTVEVEVDKDKAPRDDPSSDGSNVLEKKTEEADKVIDRPAAVSPSK